MSQYAPIARIVLRYLVGAAIVGSGEIGEQLAADPDLVMLISALIGMAVEAGYVLARKRGWAT